MTTRRKTIPLNAAEDRALRFHYIDQGIPSDQYVRRPAERRQFIALWNAISDRADTEEEVIHYIITKRKAKKWPTFDGTHIKQAAIASDFLTPSQWEALKQAYSAVLLSRGLGSDNMRFDRALAKELASEFRKLTGTAISSALLLAAIEAKRKRGEWLKLNGNVGFRDIGQVG